MSKIVRHKPIGQSTVEFAVLLAVVAAAFLAMQVYVKRGLQGRIRNLSDQLSLAHYEPAQTTSLYTIEQTGMVNQTYVSGISETQIPEQWKDDAGKPHQGEQTTRWGHEKVTPEEIR